MNCTIQGALERFQLRKQELREYEISKLNSEVDEKLTSVSFGVYRVEI